MVDLRANPRARIERETGAEIGRIAPYRLARGGGRVSAPMKLGVTIWFVSANSCSQMARAFKTAAAAIGTGARRPDRDDAVVLLARGG